MYSVSLKDGFMPDKIDEAIAKMKQECGYDPCLFANRFTLRILINSTSHELEFKNLHGYSILREKHITGWYKGYRVFEDDTIEYGEIELR